MFRGRLSATTRISNAAARAAVRSLATFLGRPTVIPELCTDSLCECGCVRSGLTAVVRWELGNWSFGFSVPGFPSRPESASAKPRSEVACFQYVAASA